MLSVGEIQDMNITMLGLGRPIEKDGEGYNKPDFSRMELIGMLSSEPTLEETYLTLSTLRRYENTQLRAYKDDIEETFKAYQEKFFEKYPDEDRQLRMLDKAKDGFYRKDSDYRNRELEFFGVKEKSVLVAFREYVEIDLRPFEAKWMKSPSTGKFAIKVPFEELDRFLDYAKGVGRFGYEAPQALKEAHEHWKEEKAKEPEPDLSQPIAHLKPMFKQNDYGYDMYELDMNKYNFNQQLWRMKDKGLKYVDAKSFKDKVIITTNDNMLPRLLRFMKENRVDVSEVETAPKIDYKAEKNKSGLQLVDVTKLDLPFKPYPFQVEDAQTVVGKKKALLGHDMGCVSGKSKVRIKEEGKSATREVYVENLFRLIQANPTIKVKSLVNGRFAFMPIKAVIDKGIRETICIETENGVLECTPDHEIYTDNGWIEAGKLSAGDFVFTDNTSIPQKTKIINIKSAPKQQVYDIAIDDAEIHNFICNGIVVHNCGKTFISALVGMSIPEKKLVICPETLRLNWMRELQQAHKGADIKLVYAKDKKPEFGKDWTVMGYKTAVKFAGLIMDEHFNCMFVDEAHKCKAVNSYGNPASQQAKTVMTLAQNMDYTYLLTGTPMPTRNKDLFNELVMLGEVNPNRPYAFHNFALEYCNAHKNGFGWDYGGSSNVEELHETLNRYMTRRLKSEVLPHLTKQRIPIVIDTPLSKEYRDIEKRLHKMEKGDTYMGLAMKGRNALSKCKADSAIELAEDILEQNEPVVLVAEFNETLDAMMEHFGDAACCIRGGMSDSAKQQAIDDFQSGAKQVCCINLIAAGVGITLTKAHNMVVCDYDWTPANMTQVEDRICRTGQKESCNIYYMCHQKSVLDEIFMDMITNKSENIDRVIDDSENTVDLIGMLEKGAETEVSGSFIDRLRARIEADNETAPKSRTTRKKKTEDTPPPSDTDGEDEELPKDSDRDIDI